MHGLARHFDEFTTSTPEFRQWVTVLLDYNAENAKSQRPARMGALLGRARTSPVCVLRKGSRLASFGGRVSAAAVEEWLASLRMGEVAWASLDDGS
jgi:hypothetical protein